MTHRLNPVVLHPMFNRYRIADLVSPIGLVAEFIASFFTPPPGDFRVGTDRRVLTFQLVIMPLFAALLWMRTRMRRVTPTSNALLALQVALGVSGMSSLLYVLAAQLAIVLPVRIAFKWLATQILLLAAVVIYLTLFHGLGLRDGTIKLVWMYSSLGLIFQLIAFGVAWLAAAATIAAFAGMPARTGGHH